MKKKHYICLICFALLLLVTRVITLVPYYGDVYPHIYLYRTDILVCGHLVHIIEGSNEIPVYAYRLAVMLAPVLLIAYLIRLAVLVIKSRKKERG